MRNFAHTDARSVDEAIGLLSARKGISKVNAGGTDLLSILKDDILPVYPELIINIKTIPGLDYIREEKGALVIGALTRLCDIIDSPLVNGKYGLLVQAARAVGSPQIRKVATVGGNLCQDVRCWYYRYPDSIGGRMMCARKGRAPCLAIKGDDRYHAIVGGKRCFAVCPSDLAVALAVLDGEVLVIGPKGQRSVAAVDFFNPMGNALAPDEMVLAVSVPARKAGGFQLFLKFTLRKPIDFAIVSAAVLFAFEERSCVDARIVLGAVGPGPVRAMEAEAMLVGKVIDEEIAAGAADVVLKDAKPLSGNAYKVRIARTLVKRAILQSIPALAKAGERS